MENPQHETERNKYQKTPLQKQNTKTKTKKKRERNNKTNTYIKCGIYSNISVLIKIFACGRFHAIITLSYAGN